LIKFNLFIYFYLSLMSRNHRLLTKLYNNYFYNYYFFLLSVHLFIVDLVFKLVYSPGNAQHGSLPLRSTSPESFSSFPSSGNHRFGSVFSFNMHSTVSIFKFCDISKVFCHLAQQITRIDCYIVECRSIYRFGFENPIYF